VYPEKQWQGLAEEKLLARKAIGELTLLLAENSLMTSESMDWITSLLLFINGVSDLETSPTVKSKNSGLVKFSPVLKRLMETGCGTTETSVQSNSLNPSQATKNYFYGD
jgi:hypothetical protein